MLDSSKLKELADDNFKVGENGIMFYKRVENTGKKEKLLVTKRPVLQTSKKQGLFRKGLRAPCWSQSYHTFLQDLFIFLPSIQKSAQKGDDSIRLSLISIDRNR